MLLRFEPYPQQLEAVRYWLDDETEEIAFGGAKYGGKSHLGCNLIFCDALTYPETDYFIARESLNDLRKHTLPSVNEVFQRWGIAIGDYARFNGQDNFYQINNGSRVLLIEARELPSDPNFERYGSMQMTRGWIEEGSQVSELAKNNLKATIGRRNNDRYGLKGKLLITCNPRKPHWLERDFYRPHVEGRLPRTRKFVRSLPTDNLKGNPEYIDALSRIPDPIMRARLFEGSWDYDNDPAKLLDPIALASIFTNVWVPEGDKALICDVALEGADDMTMGYFNGWRLEELVVIPKSKGPEAIAAIAAMEIKHQVPRTNIVIDSDGIGGPIAHHFDGCFQFKANASVVVTGDPLNYKDFKSQCAWRLKSVVNGNGLFVAPTEHGDRVTNELGSLRKADVDTDKKLSIQSKKEQKKLLGGKSPDVGDLFIMRAALDIRPNSSLGEVFATRAAGIPDRAETPFLEWE